MFERAVNRPPVFLFRLIIVSGADGDSVCAFKRRGDIVLTA